MGAIIIVLTLAVVDTITHRAPNWLTFPLIMLGCTVNGWPHAASMLAVGAFVWLAGFPGGDVKGAAAMAAWVPPVIMISGLVGALIATLALMPLTRHKKFAHLADEPWLLLLAICLLYATLLQVATPLGGGPNHATR